MLNNMIPPPELSFKIDGIPNPALFGDTVEVIVDTSVFMPGMFVIVVEEKPEIPGIYKYIDNALMFRLGARVEISAKAIDLTSMLPKSNTLIKGEITSVEPIFSASGRAQLRIRGYDLGHRLTLGKKTRTFGDGNPMVPTLTDMQIVATIAADNGLIPKVDMKGLKGLMYHYVLQYNQSDWDFLWSRAQMLGYQVYVDDRTLCFEPAGKERGKPVALVWQQNLTRFEPRIVASGAVTSVSATGWDGDKKMEVSGSSSVHLSSTMAVIPGAALPGSKQVVTAYMKRPKDAVVEPGMTTPAMASALAAARFAEHESSFVRASGELEMGDPFLVAGTTLLVTNVGARFSGKYFATEARHVYRAGRYAVHFQVSGRNPYSIRSLLLGKEHEPNKIYGVMPALVTSNTDPEMLGRVRVKFPWLPESGLDSAWARLALPGAGVDRGVFFVPEVNDEVLVAFENGDPSAPYVVGALWNSKDKPPKAPAGVSIAAGKVNQRIVRSRTGHVIVLDDTQGQEKITIQDKTGKNSIEIDSTKNSMSITTQGDLTIDVGGKLTIKSKLDFMVQGQAKGEIKAQTNLDMQAQTGASLKAGQSQLDLQAAGAALKGTKVDLQGQAQTNIQGAQTSVKGSAMVEIQGALVKIN
jgi:phage protein D/phage baseplate assembly protein gpV